LIIGIVFITSCSDDSNPIENNSSKDIIPLAVGNNWKYNFALYDTAGNIYSNFNSTSTIIGDTTTESIKWFYFDKNALYFTVLNDGYHTYDRYKPDSLRNNLVYKYPCLVGDKYSYWEVTKIDTQITVPAGSINSILYSYRLKTSDSFEYVDVFISPGVGIIKTIDYGFIPNHPIFKWKVSELLEYQLQY